MTKNSDLLVLLKLDLLITSSAIDSFLTQLLDSAREMISREGVTLRLENAEDNQLILGYAAYLFRQRKDANMQMPRWLRYALNNRVLSEKAGGI